VGPTLIAHHPGKIAALGVLHCELLCEAADLQPGERVLDVAAGSGNTSIAAARRFCQVTATDFVPELLQQAAQRARIDGLPLETQVADAQALPFEDGAFDVVLSTFGVVFAPDQQRAADELVEERQVVRTHESEFDSGKGAERRHAPRCATVALLRGEKRFRIERAKIPCVFCGFHRVHEGLRLAPRPKPEQLSFLSRECSLHDRV